GRTGSRWWPDSCSIRHRTTRCPPSSSRCRSAPLPGHIPFGPGAVVPGEKRPSMHQVELFGMQLNNFDFRDLANYLEKTIEAGDPTYLLTCNVDHVMCLQKDELFRRIYREAHAVVADGMPIVWTSRIAGTPLKQRVAGSDMLTELGLWLERKRYRLFFLGAAEGVAEEAKRRLQERFPALMIVGCYSPPFGFESMEEENEKIVAMIREARPDILLVGLGAPKQEKWIYRRYRQYRVPVSIGVGATFDFL